MTGMLKPQQRGRRVPNMHQKSPGKKQKGQRFRCPFVQASSADYSRLPMNCSRKVNMLMKSR
ncbi:hypothetical protein F9K88_08495 [Brucella intermedia]|nr:hypothetical protein F9K88_08495 [Brucella intermedia]